MVCQSNDKHDTPCPDVEGIELVFVNEDEIYDNNEAAEVPPPAAEVWQGTNAAVDSNDNVISLMFTDMTNSLSPVDETEEETEIPLPILELSPVAPIKFYSCIGSDRTELESAGNARQVNLAFDYEIHTALPKYTAVSANSATSNVNQGAEAFEKSLALGLAEQAGIAGCGGDSSEGGSASSVLRVSVGEDTDKSFKAGDVVGISADPADDVDVGTAECTTFVKIHQPSICTPMKGYVTAWIAEEDVRLRGRRSLTEESDLLNLVEDYISDFQSDNILAVSYIGSRNVAEAFSPEIEEEDILSPIDDNDDKVSTLDPQVMARAETGVTNNDKNTKIGGGAAKLAIPIVIGSLALALIGVVYLKRRRRSARRQAGAMGAFPVAGDSDSDNTTLESGSDIFLDCRGGSMTLPPNDEVVDLSGVEVRPNTTMVAGSLAELDSLALRTANSAYDNTSVAPSMSAISVDGDGIEYHMENVELRNV